MKGWVQYSFPILKQKISSLRKSSLWRNLTNFFWNSRTGVDPAPVLPMALHCWTGCSPGKLHPPWRVSSLCQGNKSEEWSHLRATWAGFGLLAFRSVCIYWVALLFIFYSERKAFQGILSLWFSERGNINPKSMVGPSCIQVWWEWAPKAGVKPCLRGSQASGWALWVLEVGGRTAAMLILVG